MSTPTLVELVRDALAGPDRPLLCERDANGAWATVGSTAALERVRAIAAGLRARGVAPGDRVALMSPNRADWILAGLGILFAGAVSVPIFATQALDQVAYIAADSGARLLFTDTPENAAKLRAAGVTVETIVFDARLGADDALTTLIAQGRAAPAADAGVAPGDLAFLIYTSGTTGTPKGVMLSHGNVAANALAAFELAADDIRPGEPVLSILPFAHIYESTNVFGYLLRGAHVYINRRVEALLDDLKAVRPVMMFTVPRIFERTYAGIIAKARAEGGIKRKLVPWAFAVGRRYHRAKLAGRPGPGLTLQYRLLHALVLRKIKTLLGCDRLRHFICGSAPLHEDLTLSFAACGIRIYEGYGLTEASPVVSCNRPDAARLGSVGRTIPGVEVRIAADGEVLVRGPNVMLGYYRDPDATAERIRDGWLATGDVGSLEDGFLRIVDRKNEMFKTSGGKFVSPARVEAAIARSPFVAQVLVIGRGRPHPAALVSPNWPALRSRMQFAAEIPVAALAARDDVRAFVAAECARQTADLAPFEQIRWAGVLPRDLTIEDGELTPTLKVRRGFVAAKFGALVAEYA